MKTISFLVPLLTAAYVSAHGFLRTVTVNGQAYVGNIPAGTDNSSAIRQVITSFPNKGASNPALTCGPNSTAGTLVANANPGDSLTFSWKAADLANWVHDIGPMLTYMANCGSVTCDQFDITQAKWFKISEIGRKPNSSDWFQIDVMNGGTATTNIPATLAPGNYLLRHEIIALHLANSLGGAEFYPACAQIKVGGSQTGAPNPDELVSIPGAYSDNDPGIFDVNVFDPTASYIFPGPAIAAFVGVNIVGTSTSGSTSTPLSSNTTTTTPSGSGSASASPPAQTSSSASSKSCKIKRRSSTPTSEVVLNHPRHFSRIMRRFAFSGSHHRF